MSSPLTGSERAILEALETKSPAQVAQEAGRLAHVSEVEEIRDRARQKIRASIPRRLAAIERELTLANGEPEAGKTEEKVECLVRFAKEEADRKWGA